MGGEYRRRTAQEVLTACQRGDRDFRGDDLSGLDLRGADLRGADFRGAILKGACLAGCQLGPPYRWRLAQQVISILVGAGAGAFNVFISLINTAALDDKDMLVAARPLFGLFVLFTLGVFVRRGLGGATGVAIAVAVAGAFAGAGAVAVAGAFAFAFAGADAIAVAGAVAFAFAGAVAVAVAVAVAGAVAFAFAGAVASAVTVVVAVGFAGASSNFVSKPLVAAAIAIVIGIGLPALSFYLRRRALAGDPRDAWLRDFALWLPGLGGARFAGADLTDADLSQVQARGANLRRARLVRTTFREARELHLARFDGHLQSVSLQRLASGLPARSADLAGQDLTGLALDGAELQGANLRGAILKETRLSGAHLDQACLEYADLCGADLRSATLRDAALRGARVDVHTFKNSGWTADELAGLCERGVDVLSLDDFPESVQVRLLGEKEGLTLYFSTRLNFFDKMLVEGALASVMGPDMRCGLESRVQGEAVLVRLFDAPRADLERVAEALSLKVWEQAQIKQRALVRAPVIQSDDLLKRLSDLVVRHLKRVELREAAPLGTAVLRWRWDNPTQSSLNQLIGPRPCRLFLIHARPDRDLAAALVGHLQPLVLQKLVDSFDETSLQAGDDADELLFAHLDSADAILVLVSADLFQEGPWYNQLDRAMARQKNGVPVIPVLVRPVSWKGTVLSDLKPLPEDGIPVTVWPNRDQAWFSVVEGLRRALLNQAQG
jgi:uncharacterized protein YjbI with pentapeptide repeats